MSFEILLENNKYILRKLNYLQNNPAQIDNIISDINNIIINNNIHISEISKNVEITDLIKCLKDSTIQNKTDNSNSKNIELELHKKNEILKSKIKSLLIENKVLKNKTDILDFSNNINSINKSRNCQNILNNSEYTVRGDRISNFLNEIEDFISCDEFKIGIIKLIQNNSLSINTKFDEIYKIFYAFKNRISDLFSKIESKDNNDKKDIFNMSNFLNNINISDLENIVEKNKKNNFENVINNSNTPNSDSNTSIKTVTLLVFFRNR